MSFPKILLYYVFAPVADPEAVRLWQRELCESLGLRGRIIISTHGINPTLLRMDNFEAFCAERREALLKLIEGATGKAAYRGEAAPTEGGPVGLAESDEDQEDEIVEDAGELAANEMEPA